MSTKPLFLLRKAKKSSGEPDVVLWASNDFESTCATLDYLIVKSGKKLSSYFKAVATNFPVVNDLPAEGEIDFTWSERYQLSKDSMTWELKPGAAPDNAHYQGNTNVNGEDMTEIEENMLLPISGQELPIRWLAQHGSEKPVTHVSRDGLQALHIARAEELPAVTALAVSHKTSLLDPLEIRELHKLVRDTDKVFPNPGNSNLGLITAFFEAYLNADYTDRGLLTKEWMKGNRVSHITRTASGANAGGGNLTDRGEGFVHDLTSLARDVATGVLARSMDLDIYNLHPAHAKRIEEIIAENKPPFSVFRDKFITMPGGLDYSRAIVVASVKEAPIGIEVIPAHVTEYLNKVLTETDHANPDPEIVDIACGRSSAPMPQRVTEEGKQDDEEKPQPSGTTAVEQGEAETMEPDATEHHQDTQPLDAQSQVNSVDAKYQELRAELHEARKNIPSKNPVDADKLLAASRGEFVDGISDPNDPKWVKGIQTRDCVYQNQPETEKTSPDMNQPEPVVQQEPEIACNACGQTGGDSALGHAYLLPFGNKNEKSGKKNVQLIIGYRGMIDLARRSGQIASLSARVVREGDEFSFEFGLDEKLIHRPGENEDAPVTHVYAVARLKDGGTQFEVMTRKQIELVRSLSKAGNNGPWVTHWEEMAKKTAIRRLFKYLPVSIEIQRAVSMDEKEPLTIDPADSSVLTGEYSVIDNSEE
ncbi:TPA: recombination protein RecT [Escherichia coli]